MFISLEIRDRDQDLFLGIKQIWGGKRQGVLFGIWETVIISGEKKNYWGFLKNWEETKSFFVSNKMGDFLIESYVDANSYEEKAPNERVYELTD